MLHYQYYVNRFASRMAVAAATARTTGEEPTGEEPVENAIFTWRTWRVWI